MNQNTKNGFVFAVGLLALYNTCYGAESISCSHEGKILTSTQMSLVDAGTMLQPYFMRDAWKLKEVAKNILNTINKLEAAALKNNSKKLFALPQDETLFVQKWLGAIVKHLTSLFGPVRGYNIIVVPLLEESLGTKENPILIDFFKSDQSIAIDVFFNQHVQSVDALKKLCWEAVIFYNDLYKSLSAPSKEQLQQALQPMLDAIKKAQAAKKSI